MKYTEDKDMLKVGVVGVGGISGAHIPAWEAREDAELVALCDVRQECLDKYPEKRHYTDFEEMLANEELDILDICLPTYLHVEFAIKALEKGIHVICEKPISLHAEDITRAYDTAHKNHVNFMIAHVLRWWPEYELLKQLNDSGKYGKILSGSMDRISAIPLWSWDNWMSDENRSGLVPYDLHIHDLDFLVYAFGAPKNVVCRRSKRPEQDVLHIDYDFDQFFVSAKSAWYAGRYPFAAGYLFQFEKAVVEYQNGVCTVYEDNGTVYHPTEASDASTGPITIPQSNAYANEINYFADCVTAGIFPDKVKPEELLTVVNTLNSF